MVPESARTVNYSARRMENSSGAFTYRAALPFFSLTGASRLNGAVAYIVCGEDKHVFRGLEHGARFSDHLLQ
jgi:hypothetical protein